MLSTVRISSLQSVLHHELTRRNGSNLHSYDRSNGISQRSWNSLRHRFRRIPLDPHGTFHLFLFRPLALRQTPPNGSHSPLFDLRPTPRRTISILCPRNLFPNHDGSTRPSLPLVCRRQFFPLLVRLDFPPRRHSIKVPCHSSRSWNLMANSIRPLVRLRSYLLFIFIRSSDCGASVYNEVRSRSSE